MELISALLLFLFKFYLLDSVPRNGIAPLLFIELGKDFVAKIHQLPEGWCVVSKYQAAFRIQSNVSIYRDQEHVASEW